MKFRAEPKDVMMFIAFCFFLLYMVAIGVLNATSLLNTGNFYGVVPFEAFSGEYIATTLTFFFLVLIGIFVAVSSYFFDREKGFGFKTSKKDKGYSRWAKDKEIKTAKNIHEIDPKAYTAPYAGIPVINNGNKMWVDDGEMHNLVVGSTGAGKTSLVVFPQVHSLAKKGESIILTDPKGELYEQTAEMLKERGYNIIVLNFRSPQNGNAWNPMALPYKLYKEGNTDKAIELLDDLALNILYQEKSSGDPFWEKTAADYFTGLALGLFEDAKEEQVNLNSINLMSNVGEERFGGPNNNFIKEYFNSKDPSKPAYINASGTVFTAEETKQGILATFKQKIKLFSSRENLSEMLSYSDFDMKDIGRKKTAVFLIVQDEKKTLHPLATIFIKQCYETLIDVAQESGGKLPFRTNFILDEFANMPPLKDVTTMVTAARSRLIRFTFIIQNYAQLAQVYGKENGDTIRGNCNILYLISNELAALEEISKMCGEVKSKEKEKTSSTPLVTVSDLQRLSYGEAIWLRLRMMPYKTKLTDHYKMSFGKKYEKAGYPIRDKKEVQLFDLKQFVKDMKKNQMQQMLGDIGDGPEINPMPFGLPGLGGMNGGANPFMSSNNEMPQTFNVDDLVKRIDAKIAELEEEEKQEKAAQEKQEKLDNKEKKNDKKLYEDDTDDDKFFDDFFNDED
ncbi:traG/TraD family protein [Clostridium sp. CAG:762]|nr:traG/TraD family protein [Clostridium sp. CAG:762]